MCALLRCWTPTIAVNSVASALVWSCITAAILRIIRSSIAKFYASNAIGQNIDAEGRSVQANGRLHNGSLGSFQPLGGSQVSHDVGPRSATGRRNLLTTRAIA
jgi:hypothetical protein